MERTQGSSEQEKILVDNLVEETLKRHREFDYIVEEGRRLANTVWQAALNTVENSSIEGEKLFLALVHQSSVEPSTIDTIEPTECENWNDFFKGFGAMVLEAEVKRRNPAIGDLDAVRSEHFPVSY